MQNHMRAQWVCLRSENSAVYMCGWFSSPIMLLIVPTTVLHSHADNGLCVMFPHTNANKGHFRVIPLESQGFYGV